MEPKSFEEIVQLIQTNPAQADDRARRWDTFVRQNEKQNPELDTIASLNDWQNWFSGHQAIGVGQDIFEGKQIRDSYFTLGENHESGQLATGEGIDPTSLPPMLQALPFLAAAFRNRPRTMEEDGSYQKIAEERKKTWLSEHGQKDFTMQEGVDYLYGSLEGDEIPSLQKDSEKIFREKFPQKAQKYDGQRTKVYKLLNNDPFYENVNRHIEEEIVQRAELFKKARGEDFEKGLRETVKTKRWVQFVKQHPEKAKWYSEKNDDVKKTYDQYGIGTIVESARVTPGREPSPISQEEITRRFETINREREEREREGSSISPRTLQRVFQEPRPTIPGAASQATSRLPIRNVFSQAGRGLGNVSRFGGSAIGSGARLAIQTGVRAGVTAATGAIGTIGAPLWIIIGGVLLAIVLIVVVFFGGDLSGQTPTASAGTAPFVPGIVPARPQNDTYPDLYYDILREFRVEFENFDPNLHYNYLLWAWEKLWNAENTQFLQLVRGSSDKIVVRRSDGTFSEFSGCSPPTVNMSGVSSATGKPYEEQLYKVVLMHELSHVIHNCNKSFSRLDQLQNIIQQEGYITAYSQSSLDCSITRTPNLTEDYAEMLAYFLNPELNEVDFGFWRRDTMCLPPRSGKPYERGFPLHQKLAADILGVTVQITPGLTKHSLSCPVENGQVSTPSYQTSSVTGHCGTDYTSKGYVCDQNSRRAKSVDVLTDGGPNGKDVRLPRIDGQIMRWHYLDKFTLALTDCLPEEKIGNLGCGIGIAFQATDSQGQNWTLHLLHMYEPRLLTLTKDQEYPSDIAVGKTETIHVHVTIGENVIGDHAFAIAGSNDTRSGWLAADKDMGMCSGAPPVT